MESILAGAVAQQQAQIQLQTQVSVLKTTIDAQKTIGNIAIELLDAATRPVGKSPDNGKLFDAYA